MSTVRDRFVGLCLPPLAFSLLDLSLTLAGQSATYWSGQYQFVNEVSPTFHTLLSIHPLAFAAGGLFWITVFCSILLLLPDTLALIVSIAVTFGHVAGSATWILYRFQFGYQTVNGMFLLAAILLGLGIRYGWKAGPSEPYRLPAWLQRWRWVLSAALFAIGVYLFLWPRTAGQ